MEVKVSQDGKKETVVTSVSKTKKAKPQTMLTVGGGVFLFGAVAYHLTKKCYVALAAAFVGAAAGYYIDSQIQNKNK